MERHNPIASAIRAFRTKHAGLYQFISYALLGLVASAVEVCVFALLNYWVLRAWKEVDFHWWILNYNAQTGGGLGGFLAGVLSYLVGQIVNFFIQRKATFRANNNPVGSAAMYLVFICLLWFFQVYMIGLLMRVFEPVMGAGLGDILADLLSMTMGFTISFPINKFVIMRRRGGRSAESPQAEDPHPPSA